MYSKPDPYNLPELRFEAQDPDRRQEVAVVFTDYMDPNRHRAPWWLRYFTRDKYRHCFSLVKSAAGGTIIINALWDQLYVEHTNYPIAHCALACIRSGLIVRKVDAKFRPRYTPRGLITCVSVIKAILGINHAKIITPYQLDRYLVKRYMIDGGDENGQ